MADEKNIVKKEGQTKLQKVLNWFKRLPKLIAKPFKNMWHELKLVTWPTKQELINNAIIVAVFIVLLSVVIGGLDLGASNLVNRLIG